MYKPLLKTMWMKTWFCFSTVKTSMFDFFSLHISFLFHPKVH